MQIPRLTTGGAGGGNTSVRLGAPAQSARLSVIVVVVVVRLRLLQLLSGPHSCTRPSVYATTVIRDAFPSVIETPAKAPLTKLPTYDDGVYGERPDQTADGPEPVAAEHPDTLALADTSQKASPDHREDLVQGDVQRYGEHPRELPEIVLSAEPKRCPGLDDAAGCSATLVARNERRRNF